MRLPALAAGFVFFGAFLVSSPAWAQCVEYGEYIHWDNTLDIPGATREVDIVGPYAYILTQGTVNLWVVDIDLTHGSYLDIVGGLSLGTVMGGECMAVSDTRACIAKWDYCVGGELDVLDVSNPHAPQLLGSVNVLGNVHAVAISGDYAYMTEGCLYQGLQVVDISVPGSPQIVASVPTAPAEAKGVAISGQYAYVTTRDWNYPGSGSLLIIDIADPGHPQLVSSLVMPGYGAGALAVNGKYAYVAANGLYVVDISNPQNPKVLSCVVSGISIDWLLVDGNYLYFRGPGCQVADISNPESPVILGGLELENAFDAAVSHSRVYVADDDLQVIDVSHPHDPPIVGGVGLPGSSFDVAVNGTFAYIAAGGSGLQVVDAAVPQNPVIAGGMDTPGNALGIAFFESRAYIADGGAGLQVIDVADPWNPQYVGGVDSPGTAQDVAVANGYAYLVDQNGTAGSLLIIDIDPANPNGLEIVGSVGWFGEAYGVAVSSTHAFVANQTGSLEVIDISNPWSPQVVGGAGVGCARGVAIQDEYVYVANWGSLLVLDATNPSSPQHVGTVDHLDGDAQFVTVSGSYAYLGRCFQVIDISDPRQPRFINSNSAPDWCMGVAVAGGYAYIADNGSGLQIMPAQCGATSDADPVSLFPVLPLRIQPNPMTQQTGVQLTLWAGGRVVAAIHDAAGRRVRSLLDGDLIGGAHDLGWDGRDDTGYPVASGIYLVRVLTPEGERRGRVVILR